MNNRIVNGDCTEVLKTVAAESVDFVLTDPPYFVCYKDRSGRTIRNDSHPGTVLKAFDDVYRVLKPNSLCISFYGWQAVDAFMQAWKSAGFASSSTTTNRHTFWRKAIPLFPPNRCPMCSRGSTPAIAAIRPRRPSAS
jgi:DNA modification methylase